MTSLKSRLLSDGLSMTVQKRYLVNLWPCSDYFAKYLAQRTVFSSVIRDCSGVAEISTARYLRLLALACLSAVTLTACSQPTEPQLTQGKKMTETKKEVVSFDIVLFSYLDRPIFDVSANGKWVGDADAFGGGGGLISGVKFPLGPQVVTWQLGGPEGMPNNGDTVKATNQPVLSRPDQKMHYLGVHIYPDNSVEFVPSQFWPEITEKGNVLFKVWKKKHGE